MGGEGRKMRLVHELSALAVAIVLGLGLPARAADVIPPSGFEIEDSELFKPTMDPSSFVSVYDSRTVPAGRFSLGLVNSYSFEPLTGRRILNGHEGSVGAVDHLGTMSLLAAVGVAPNVELGIEVPGYVTLFNDVDIGLRHYDGKAADLGDVRLSGKVSLLPESVRDQGFGLAIVPIVGFPTGHRTHFAGTGNWTGGGLVAADATVERFRFGVNFGGFIRDDFGDRGHGDQHEDILRWGVATATEIHPRAHFIAEGYGVTDAGDPFGEEFRTPIEIIGGVRIALGVFDLFVGGGGGVNGGKNAADWRFILGATAPQPELIQPPNFSTSRKTYVVEDYDRNGQVSPGDVIVYTVTIVNTGPSPAHQVMLVDPIPDSTDYVAGDLKLNGQAIPDGDGYKIGPPRVEVPIGELGNQPGSNEATVVFKARIRPDIASLLTIQNVARVSALDTPPVPLAPVDTQVFPAVAEREHVIATPEKLEITDRIHFEFDKAVIRPESYPILDEVASILKEKPAMELMIVGHTDSLGSDDYNLRLSQARASSVRNYLIEKGGISPSRLQSSGRGEFEPIASNDTDEGRALNRRVEFMIVKQ